MSFVVERPRSTHWGGLHYSARVESSDERWGLYELDDDEELLASVARDSESVTPVSRSFEMALYSGEMFPAALAFVRAELRRGSEFERAEDFCECLERKLRGHMDRRVSGGCILVNRAAEGGAGCGAAPWSGEGCGNCGGRVR